VRRLSARTIQSAHSRAFFNASHCLLCTPRPAHLALSFCWAEHGTRRLSVPEHALLEWVRRQTLSARTREPPATAILCPGVGGHLSIAVADAGPLNALLSRLRNSPSAEAPACPGFFSFCSYQRGISILPCRFADSFRVFPRNTWPPGPDACIKPRAIEGGFAHPGTIDRRSLHQRSRPIRKRVVVCSLAAI